MPLDLTTIDARPPAQLDDSALLALVLNHSQSSAATLLARFGGLHGLARTPFDELAAARVPPRRALQLHAALELGRRSLAEPLRLGRALTSAADVVDAMRARLAALDQEYLVVLGFDSRQRVVVDVVVAIGGGSEVACVPADALRPLILAGAQRFIVVLNHPSGAVEASDLDHDLTRRLASAGDLVGLCLIDHIIVGRDGAYSCAARKKIGV